MSISIAHPKSTLGPTTLIDLCGYHDIPAKIDTGADSSAVWASDITVSPEKVLSFKLFAPNSPLFDGKTFTRSHFRRVYVKSSNGARELRYVTTIPIVLGGRHINARFTLSDRSKNTFPVLIGRKTLSGKFLVDVSQKDVKINNAIKQTGVKK